MATVGIFFGSDTGNTEHVAKMIQKELGKNLIAVHDIAKSSKEDIAAYDLLMFGIPTWYYGEAQCDWDDFFPELENIDFSNKLVALFGCGDQEDCHQGALQEEICRRLRTGEAGIRRTRSRHRRLLGAGDRPPRAGAARERRRRGRRQRGAGCCGGGAVPARK